MELTEAIHRRRAYRSLDPAEIDEKLVRDLAEHAQLAASCFNNQPWRFVFVYDPEMLDKMKSVFSKGNEWCHYDSMIIAVFTKPDLDCQLKTRDYYLFDTGMAVAHLILRATDLGLVAHPIAGYSESKVKEILGIPDDMRVITLINVGKHREEMREVLSDRQRKDEQKRPERKPFDEFAYIDKYTGEK